MTYGELREVLHNLTEEQLGCDVTVELGITDEFYVAELRISGSENDVLDEDHPVIYVEDA